MTCDATPAWTLTSAMWCATTSCSSRAMRIRSSATRRLASSSRVRSARSARSWMALDVGAAAADRVAGGRRHARPGDDPEVLLRVPGAAAGEHRRRGQHDDGHGTDPPGGGPVGAGGEGEERDDGGGGHRGARIAGADGQFHDGQRAGGGEDRTGQPAAQDQDGTGEAGQRHGHGRQVPLAEPWGAVRAVRIGDRADQDRHEGRHRQDRVERERMRPVPVKAAGAGRVLSGVEGGHKRKR